MDSQNTLISMQMRTHQLKKKLSEAWKRKIEEQRERERLIVMIEPLFYLSLIIWLKLLVEATSQRGSRCTVMQSSPPSFATSHSQSFFSEMPINTAVKPAVRQTSSDNQTSCQMPESDFQWRWDSDKSYWTNRMKRFDSLPIMKKLKLRKTRFLYALPGCCHAGVLDGF